MGTKIYTPSHTGEEMAGTLPHGQAVPTLGLSLLTHNLDNPPFHWSPPNANDNPAFLFNNVIIQLPVIIYQNGCQ